MFWKYIGGVECLPWRRQRGLPLRKWHLSGEPMGVGVSGWVGHLEPEERGGTCVCKDWSRSALAHSPSNNLMFSCCLTHLARKTGSQVCCLQWMTYCHLSNPFSVKSSIMDWVCCPPWCVSTPLDDTSHMTLWFLYFFFHLLNKAAAPWRLLWHTSLYSQHLEQDPVCNGHLRKILNEWYSFVTDQVLFFLISWSFTRTQP